MRRSPADYRNRMYYFSVYWLPSSREGASYFEMVRRRRGKSWHSSVAMHGRAMFDGAELVLAQRAKDMD